MLHNEQRDRGAGRESSGEVGEKAFIKMKV